MDCTSVGKVCALIKAGAHCHAALGALFLTGVKSDYLVGSPRRKTILQLAAGAVLKHHSTIAGDLDPKEHPLAFLLAMADEFGREVVVWLKSANGRRARFVAPVTHMTLIEDGGRHSLHLHPQKGRLFRLLRDQQFNKAIYVASKEHGIQRLNDACSTVSKGIDRFDVRVV